MGDGATRAAPAALALREPTGYLVALFPPTKQGYYTHS
jgi:hypothetical protein